MSQSNMEIGHRLAKAAIEINAAADELRGMDRRGSYVNPAAAAERALGHLYLINDPPQKIDLEELHEAIKELAHGLASLTRQVFLMSSGESNTGERLLIELQLSDAPGRMMADGRFVLELEEPLRSFTSPTDYFRIDLRVSELLDRGERAELERLRQLVKARDDATG